LPPELWQLTLVDEVVISHWSLVKRISSVQAELRSATKSALKRGRKKLGRDAIYRVSTKSSDTVGEPRLKSHQLS